MNDLKTAEEIFNTIPFLDICEEGKWYRIPKEKVIKAMREYATQAIDRCAEVAELRHAPGCIDSAEIDKMSILGVKDDLK